MEAWKGHALHLNAVARLKDLPDWVLWFVGGAQRPEEQLYVEALKQQAATLGIASRVRFLGQRSDVPEVLRAADIHCQPNMGPEPFGVTFVEAMLAELPIAACRMGAAPELIDASCGLLCQPGNVAELASILRLLVTNRGLRERLGSNGPARARQLSDPGSRLRELYEFVSQAPEVGKRRSLGSTVCR
jgi:glycosyltransferase involved in cell wall biosynthesis